MTFAEDIALYLLYFFSLILDNLSCCDDSVAKIDISDCVVVI
jgi:hypothetical protein